MNDCIQYTPPIPPKDDADHARWLRDDQKALEALVRQLNDLICPCKQGDPCAAVTITLTGDLPPATVGDEYTGSIAASGGHGPYEYRITSGALPDGLTMDLDGNITGTPT